MINWGLDALNKPIETVIVLRYWNWNWWVFLPSTVLVDLSEPVPGEVVDGSADDFTDLQFTTSQAKVELQWRDYYDPESNISHYDVKVYRAKFVFFFCSFNLQLN